MIHQTTIYNLALKEQHLNRFNELTLSQPKNNTLFSVGNNTIHTYKTIHTKFKLTSFCTICRSPLLRTSLITLPAWLATATEQETSLVNKGREDIATNSVTQQMQTSEHSNMKLLNINYIMLNRSCFLLENNSYQIVCLLH